MVRRYIWPAAGRTRNAVAAAHAATGATTKAHSDVFCGDDVDSEALVRIRQNVGGEAGRGRFGKEQGGDTIEVVGAVIRARPVVPLHKVSSLLGGRQHGEEDDGLDRMRTGYIPEHIGGQQHSPLNQRVQYFG